jgi:hypothetical protein
MRSTIMIGAVQAQLIEAKGVTLTADGASAPFGPLK